MANNKDIDLYQDKEATQALISEINKVAVNGINDLSTQVADAVKQLKNVHGIENVGTINTRKYNAFFNNISTDLNDVSKKVTQNDEAIDAYSNASVGKRLLSTGAMGLFKFGEGLLSVGEDLGDGAASLVGWLAPKDSKLEKACAKFVKKNWSHDVFNFYYKSDFAKQSYMKEDGKVANCFKIAGTCVGYLYAGGAAAGLARGAAAGVTKAAAKGAVKNVSKLAAKTSKIRGFASSTTKANTATMGIGGLGHGTEEGMLEGDSINKAFRTKGLKEGAIGAALGLGGGKLGEVLSKRATLKAANNELKIAKESKASLVESGEKNVSKIEEATKRVETAEKNVKNISETKASSYEGYTDSITKAGQKFGKTIKGTSKSGAEALSKTVKASKLVRKGDIRANQAVDEASKAKAAFKQNAKELVKNNPVTDAAKGSKSVAKGTVKTVKEVPKKVVNKTSKFKEAAAKRRVATKTSSATKPSTSANKQTYKVNSKPKQVVKINNVNKTAPKAAKQTVATTSKRPSVMETIRSGKAALKETAAASKAIRNGSMESHALSASAAKKGEVFKDNLRGLFGRGSNNSVAEAAVESMSVGPTAGLAASGVGKASGLRGFFARGANKVDDFTKTMDDIGESATKGSSKVRSSDDVIDKFTKEDDELFKKLEEAKPTKEKPVEGKTGEQNSYKMTSEEKAKYDKLEAENLEHQKSIDYHQKEIDRIESKSPDGNHSSEEWDELTKHRMKMDDHKKALESNERHMDELDPSRMSEEQIDRELYALRDKRYELELDKNFADDVIKETNDKVRNGESFENLPESEKTTYNYWSNKRSGMDERISKLDERIDKLESVKNNGTDKADDAVQSVQKAREEFEVKPRASDTTKTRTEDIINKADKADDAVQSVQKAREEFEVKPRASARTKTRTEDIINKADKADDAVQSVQKAREEIEVKPRASARTKTRTEDIINKADKADDASKASGRTKNQVRSEMDRVADTLAKREKSLDDAEKELSIYRKKNNIDPKDPKRVISEEEQTLINKAKNAKDDYLTQRTKLINKQKQYVEAAKEDAGKVGSEIKRTSKPKVIESKDGLKITDASAKVEGQIDGSALKSIPKEKINLIEYKAKIKNDIARVQKELDQAKGSLKEAKIRGNQEEHDFAENLVKNKEKELHKLIDEYKNPKPPKIEEPKAGSPTPESPTPESPTPESPTPGKGNPEGPKSGEPTDGVETVADTPTIKERPIPGAAAATIFATHNTRTDPTPSYLNDNSGTDDTAGDTESVDDTVDDDQIDDSQPDNSGTDSGGYSGGSSDGGSSGGSDGGYSSPSDDDTSTSPEETTPTETPEEETTTDETTDETEEQTDETQTDETQTDENQTEETQPEETTPTEEPTETETESQPQDTYTETTQTDTNSGTVTKTTPTKTVDYDDSYYDDSNDNIDEFVDSEKADEGQLIDDTNNEEPLEEEQIYDEPVDETQTDDNTEVLDDLPLPSSSKKKRNIAIPLIAGIATAGAAGTGAKIYLDRKKNQENLDDEYEYEEDEDYDYDEDSIDDIYQEEQESTDIASEAIDEGERYSSKPNSEFEDFI